MIKTNDSQSETPSHLALGDLIKSIAADANLRRMFQDTPKFRDLLLPAARRYVLGDTFNEILPTARSLSQLGYQLSLEYMGGEDSSTRKQCRKNCAAFVEVADCLRHRQMRANLCLDLSSVGLSVSTAMALDHLKAIAYAAESGGNMVILSMEEQPKVPAILSVLRSILRTQPNIGCTFQAYLRRTPDDLEEFAGILPVLRLVKGVYRKRPEDLAGASLTRRYLRLAKSLLTSRAAARIHFGTHDDQVLAALTQLSSTRNDQRVTFEMLHGVRPARLRALKSAGFQTCVYLTYGREWLVHLLHRIAEYPLNVFQAAHDLSAALGETRDGLADLRRNNLGIELTPKGRKGGY